MVDRSDGPLGDHPDGCIAQEGDVTSLAMVRPRSLGDLAKAGDNLFTPLAPTVPLEPEERQVVTGFLEASGVKPALEMVELIETSRAFEANVASFATSTSCWAAWSTTS